MLMRLISQMLNPEPRDRVELSPEAHEAIRLDRIRRGWTPEDFKRGWSEADTPVDIITNEDRARVRGQALDGIARYRAAKGIKR